MLTEKQVAEAFTEVGIDSKEKLIEHLGGAVKPAKRAAIEEKMKAEEAAFAAQRNEYSARIQALQQDLNEV